MTRIGGIVALVSCTLLWACITGVEPPLPTTLVPVAKGQFLFGSTAECLDDADKGCSSLGTIPDFSKLPRAYPTVLVDVKAFRIEEHEVTNNQYRYCVALDACTEPGVKGIAGIVDDYYGNSAYDDYPVIGITQEQAAAYCAFVGRRLPTELEWERAAAGAGTTEAAKRVTTIDNGDVDLLSCKAPVKKSVAMALCTGATRPEPAMASVDDYVEEGAAKIWDLGGNVSEWVEGAYKADLTCQGSLPNLCDCFRCATGDSTCKANCHENCTQCQDAGDACFTQCRTDSDPQPFGPDGIPRCLQYPQATAQSPDVLSVKITADNNDRPFRGGNFRTAAVNQCSARTVDRSQSALKNKQLPEVGFRCAADQ